ncbi:MAG: hypothetical protein IPN01_33750 [Deltaproteobacteria bacterium]|nr:hypothetical protein [Deltaproteobacteria bacterium]
MFVLLSLVLGCDTRCPTFDELEVRLPDDGESPTVPERAELAISNFRSWTTLDGVCVDTLRLGFNQTEWEHRPGSTTVGISSESPQPPERTRCTAPRCTASATRRTRPWAG